LPRDDGDVFDALTLRNPRLVALSERPYRRVFLASFVSQTGDWFQITGRALLIFAITNSTTALGVIYFASYIPILLFSNYGGAMADRFDRRRILIVCQSIATAGAFAMGALAATHTATLANVTVISLALGTVVAISAPSQSALMPALVEREHLTSAIGLFSVTNSAARVAGPLLAGVLSPIVGISWLFYINGVSFFFVIAAWVVTRVPRQPPVEEHSTWRAVAAGVRFARRTPPVAVAMATMVVLGGLGLLYLGLVAAWATDVLAGGSHDAGSRAYGFTQAAIGVGAVGGALVVARAHRREGRTLVVLFAGFGAALVGLSLVDTVAAAVVGCAFLGFFQFATATQCLAMIQTHAPEEMRGRLMALFTIAYVGIYPITGLAAGAIANVVGVPPLFAFGGISCLIFAVPLWRWARVLDEPTGWLVPEAVETDVAEATIVFEAEEIAAAGEVPLDLARRVPREPTGPKP
jgi:MFS family permease